MTIRKIEVTNTDRAAVEQAFREVEPQPIANCNWAEAFPYAPQVSFRMFHTGGHLMLRYEVAEQYTAALVTEDNGEVWTDSCVEFFIALDKGGYYNFEATAIGRLLLGYRISRNEGVEHASTEVLATIDRTTSLPSTPFAERVGDNHWSLTLAIPPTALYRHSLKTWDDLEARVNLYKCGDNLSNPHFLSWKPIQTEQPNFHLPEFFENIKFCK